MWINGWASILQKWLYLWLKFALWEDIEGGIDLPSGNASTILFFADMIVSYDGSSVSSQDKSSVAKEIHQVLADARDVSGMVVDFSGTHSQSDDPVGEIFSYREKYEMVQDVKRAVDPTSRFRFHPFAHLL